MIGWNHHFRFLHEVKQVWLGALEFRWRLENGRSSDHCNLLLGLNSSAVLKTIAAITAFFSLSFTKLSLTRGSRSAASLKVGSFSNGRRCFTTTINEINIYFLYFNMITTLHRDHASKISQRTIRNWVTKYEVAVIAFLPGTYYMYQHVNGQKC